MYYDFCFPGGDEEAIGQELEEIRQACLLNSAACFLRCRELDETLESCYQVSNVYDHGVQAEEPSARRCSGDPRRVISPFIRPGNLPCEIHR